MAQNESSVHHLKRDDYQLAWNAALEHAAELLDGYDVGQFKTLVAPSEAFDEWYTRSIENPPEGWDDHRAY